MKNYMLLVMMALIAIAPAVADPTITTVNWAGVYGATNVNTNFGGDATAATTFSGNNLNGNLVATDFNNNPYGYGVDSIQNTINANFGTGTEGQGGSLSTTVTKTDNYAPMYGGPGASTTTSVYSTGIGSLGMNTVANYAEFNNANYGITLPIPVPTSNQLTATGNVYNLYHSLQDATQTYGTTTFNDGASIQLAGSGSGSVTDMNDFAMGSSFKFGNGNGCYTNANVKAIGSGSMQLLGWDNSLLKVSDPNVAFIPGNGAPGTASYNLQIGFAGATTTNQFQYTNFALSGQATVGP